MRGLLRCPSRLYGQCEGLEWWDGQEQELPRFFRGGTLPKKNIAEERETNRHKVFPSKDMPSTIKYTFSGHESFPCKSLWLKKGYDFVCNGHDFNAPEAVIQLGVGKNMVSSIRFWMKSFGLIRDNALTKTAHYLLDSTCGRDPYIEALGTLWLLHYLLIFTNEASLYHLLFTRFQRERNTFDRKNVITFIKRCMSEDSKLKQYNENTVKKDVGVLLQNYTLPTKSISKEDYSPLLIDLDLIRVADGKQFSFNVMGKRSVPREIFLYAILSEMGEDETVSYDLLQNVGLMFCMNDMEVVSMSKSLQEAYGDALRYSDTAGMRQIQFIRRLSGEDVLNNYYNGSTTI